MNNTSSLAHILSMGVNSKKFAAIMIKKIAKLDFRKSKVCAVFTGRNDNYVPDFEARIRAVIEWNSKILCDEVIFVEWNPIPNKPLLSPALTKDYPNLKAYVVPNEIHKMVCTNPNMPVMEFFAKNVGIRRAKSEYICATNGDILWDPNVAYIRWFLDRKFVFRTRRVELKWNGQPLNNSFFRDPSNIMEFIDGWKQHLEFGCGDFTLAHRELWHRAKGYDESLRNSRLKCDPRGLIQLLNFGAKPLQMGIHYHIHHKNSSVSSGNSSHGDIFEYWKNLPYENSPDWGLGDCVEKQLGERVWILERR